MTQANKYIVLKKIPTKNTNDRIKWEQVWSGPVLPDEDEEDFLRVVFERTDNPAGRGLDKAGQYLVIDEDYTTIRCFFVNARAELDIKEMERIESGGPIHQDHA